MICDIHTHNPLSTEGIINISSAFEIVPGHLYSAGIHPWDSGTRYNPAALEELIARPEVVAVGETGLDALCDIPLERQEEVLCHHILLSEKYGKPLILHVVRRFDHLLRLKKELKPAQPWIVHGFRGKPQLARQLVDKGLYLSIGERFNPASLAAVPQDRLFIETDTSTLSISEISVTTGIPMRQFPFLQHGAPNCNKD